MKKVVFILLLFLPIFTFAEVVEFSDCVDGDTFKVKINGVEKTVRMLAVDTPESVHPTKEVEPYGKEASEYTCNLVSNAKKIELVYDDNSDKTDKYDRILAWVFVDDYLLQDSLVRNGYAEVAYLYDDYKYTPILQDHEALAKSEKLRIWSDSEEKEISIWAAIGIVLLTILYTYIKKKLKKISKKSKINLNMS